MDNKYANQFKSELKNILNFWYDNLIDEKKGGFYGQLTGRGELVEYADKSIILNTRILWTFSTAWQVYPLEKYRSVSHRAYHYIINNFLDAEYGGVYWMLNSEKKPVEQKKQIYAQAFAIYAFAEYHKINSNSQALGHAIDLFHLIEKYSFDQDLNGYYEAFSQSWELIEDVRLSDKDLNAQKTMNTHLHILEAYTNLYSVWPNDLLRKQLINLINLMSSTFLFPSGHFKLFFTENWDLLTEAISYGHDIEGSWLIFEAAEVIGDEELIAKTKDISLLMANATLEGLDKDGGLMNEGEEGGPVIDSDKHWWPQAEALVGFINAYQLTLDQKYLTLAKEVWDFIGQKIIDPTGEWYWRVNQSGVPDLNEDKAGPWKCPYHNGRAMMESFKRLKNEDHR